ncbi:divalent-cation tolerance protein CutA [Aquabacter spiritensis]|uniref:Periplasmic divalent cation tolerance protein n=1 Tax=Aquabacter spiritensis TaxID=933073 RepID=A0A4R3M5C7_9HYPH|nr:divalent-cation tolerance protein CutA [Aquabacter spiritensis]TCT07783.1 periplasmic divalent cation tolerance protein [Aquabacter spiritensis]
MDLKLVYSTFPSVASAEAVARTVVAERLAACANILPTMISVYAWQGVMERADEVVLLLKTTATCAADLMARVKAEHPYEVPAIVLIPLAGADSDFAAWVGAQTRPGGLPRG